jgi:hypothetical protein
MDTRPITAIIATAGAVAIPTATQAGASPNAAIASPSPAVANGSAAPSCPLEIDQPEFKGGKPPQVEVAFTGGNCNSVPGLLSVDSSADGSHWTNVRQIHTDDVPLQGTTVSCTANETKWYRASYVPDDHTFKSSAPATRWVCGDGPA